MDEIFEICDSYTILRDGTFISSGDIADVSLDKIIEDMVGRPLTQVFPERNNKIGDVILEGEKYQQWEGSKGRFVYIKKRRDSGICRTGWSRKKRNIKSSVWCG